jgi:hypothetical protein
VLCITYLAPSRTEASCDLTIVSPRNQWPSGSLGWRTEKRACNREGEKGTSNKTTIIASAALAAAIALGAVMMPAKADTVELRLLESVVDGGTGFLFGSSKGPAFKHTPANASAAKEANFWVANTFDVDVGVTGASVFAWVVAAPTSNYRYKPDLLADDCRCVSAEASAGAGVNILVGGSDDTVSLQPLGVRAREGVNVAGGIAEIELLSAANRIEVSLGFEAETKKGPANAGPFHANGLLHSAAISDR